MVVWKERSKEMNWAEKMVPEMASPKVQQRALRSVVQMVKM